MGVSQSSQLVQPVMNMMGTNSHPQSICLGLSQIRRKYDGVFVHHNSCVYKTIYSQRTPYISYFPLHYSTGHKWGSIWRVASTVRITARYFCSFFLYFQYSIQLKVRSSKLCKRTFGPAIFTSYSLMRSTGHGYTTLLLFEFFLIWCYFRVQKFRYYSQGVAGSKSG